MSLITDGLLIATCLTAGLYCFVLSRRLKRFSNTEEGIGQQVVQLNATLEEMRVALKEAQSGAKAESEALSREVVQARKLSSQLKSLIEASAKSLVREKAMRSVPDAPIEAPRSKAASPIDLDQQEETETAAPTALDEELNAEDLDDLELSLTEAPGEQQLGFLPADEFDQDDSDVDPPVLEEGVTDESLLLEEDLADDRRQRDQSKTDNGQSEGLLKVERMAI